MKKILLIMIFLFGYGCKSVSDTGKVLRNEKINNRDEFLVKKKGPIKLTTKLQRIT